MKVVLPMVVLLATTLLPEVLSQQQALFVRKEAARTGKRTTRQASADQMVQNILQWLQGVYTANSRRIRQGSFREYLPPSNTQKPRPFQPQIANPDHSDGDYNFIGYPPAEHVTPLPPFPLYTNPVTGGVTGGDYITLHPIPPNPTPGHLEGDSTQPPEHTGFPTQPPLHPSFPTQPPQHPGFPTQPPEHPGFPTQPPGFPTQPPEHPGFSTQPPQHPGFPTQPPEHPGFPTQPPEHLGFPTQPPEHPGFSTQPPEHPGFPTQPPVHPGFPTQPPEHPRFPTQPPEHPGFPTQPPEHPGFPTQTPEHPGFPTQPTQHPGFTTQPPEHPGFPTEPPQHPGISTQPPEHPGFPTQPPEHPGFPTQPPEHPGFPTQPPEEPTHPPTKLPEFSTKPPTGYPPNTYIPPVTESTGYPRPGKPTPEFPLYPPTSDKPAASSTLVPDGCCDTEPTHPPITYAPPTHPPEIFPPIHTQPPRPFETASPEDLHTPSTHPPVTTPDGHAPIYTSPAYVPSTEAPHPSYSPKPEDNTVIPGHPGDNTPGDSEITGTVIPSDEDLKHPPHIHAIDVECAKDMMTINIEFNRPFDGVIYSKGYYHQPECRYVKENSGNTKYSFTVSLNSCGTEFVNAFDTQGQSYLENVLVLQNEPGIQEVWDTIRSVRCLWEGNLNKALSVALSVGMLNQEIVTFSGDTAMAKLDIQLGKGPFAPNANGLVKIGEVMTLVVSVTGDPGFDIQVKDCKATDSGHNEVALTDHDGCVLKPKLFGAFQKTRQTGNTGASIIAYAFFNAFKFPDLMDLMIECNVELCKTDCEMCPDQHQKLEPGRRRRRDLKVYNNSGEPVTIGKMLRVILPEDLNESGVILDNNGICMSTQGFVVSSVMLISLLTASCILSAYLWLRNKHLAQKF